MLTSVAYFLSVLVGHSVLSAILAFPTIYLTPGLMFMLLLSKGEKHKFRELIIVSFFLSTVIAVTVVSTLILLGITIRPFSVASTYVLLIFTLIVLAVTIGKKPQIETSHLDYAFLGISLITYGSLVHFFTSMPRLFSMDETTYIAWSRYAILNGEIYPVGIFSFESSLLYLVKGRFFWTLLITSFIGSTGLEAHQAHVISTMFLPMIAITSTLLTPIRFRDNKFLQSAIFLLVLTNPLLLLFSGFVLNDLATAFYLILAILFFIRSFNQRGQDIISINPYTLLLSVFSLLITFLIKMHVTVILPMYIILMYYILRYRLHKNSKIWRIVLYILTLPLIVYEVLIDIPYVISVWFIKNEFVAVLTIRFLLLSPAERFLNLFIPAPWNPTTILSHNFYDYLHYFYRMLSPETLGLLVAATGITLPLTLALDGFRKDIQMRILICLTTTTLWLLYINYLSINAFWDIPRYSLFTIPILIAISLTAIYEVLSSRNIAIGVILMIPMLFLQWIQSTLSIKKGGVYVSYGLPKLNWTGFMTLVQLLVYVLVIVVALKTVFRVKTMWRKRMPLGISKTLFVMLIITIVLNNMWFSRYSLSNSYYFEEHKLKDVEKLLGDNWSADHFVVSNVYFYVRPFAPNDLLSHHYLFCPPATEEEFIRLLRVLPNNTLILLSDDRNIAWHEYANKNGYIFRYLKSSKIPVELKGERKVYDGVILDLRFDNISDGKVSDCSDNQHSVTVFGNASLVQGFYGGALNFDGIDDYICVSHNDALNPTTAITVEAYVKPITTPDSYCVVVSKGWNEPGAWTLQTTPDAKWQFAIKNQAGDYFHVEGGSVEADKWYHLVGIWDGSQLMLYVNGVPYGPVATSGNIGNTYDILVGTYQLMDAKNYWSGCIDEIRVYNRALSNEEVLEMYYGPKLIAEEGGFKLFRVETQKKLHTNSQSSGINIEAVNILWTNSTNIRLIIKANSLQNESILVYIGTFRFLKILDLKLVRGENTIILDFPRKLPNGDKYGIYIANWANIVIVDSQGKLLYHKLHTPFVLKFPNIGLWLLLMLLLLTLLLALTSQKRISKVKLNGEP